MRKVAQIASAQQAHKVRQQHQEIHKNLLELANWAEHNGLINTHQHAMNASTAARGLASMSTQASQNVFNAHTRMRQAKTNGEMQKTIAKYVVAEKKRRRSAGMSMTLHDAVAFLKMTARHETGTLKKLLIATATQTKISADVKKYTNSTWGQS